MANSKIQKAVFQIGLFVTAALITGAPACQGQTATAVSVKPESAHAAMMTFDIASVRENKNIDFNAGMMVSGGFVLNTTVFRAMNWRIEDLISNAYGVDRSQIVDGPKWPWPTVFLIEAKSGSDSDIVMSALTKEQKLAEHRHMLQVLLQQRFNFKAHWETKESDIYNLVQAKGGAKLGAAGSIPPSSDELKNFRENPVPVLYQKNDGQGYDFIAHGCSINRLAEMLTGQFGKPVIDRTSLLGNYDFVLKYKGRWDRDRNSEDLDPMPPMDRALTEELGLKVEAAKGPVKMLVVDQVAKPSAN